MSFIQKKLSKSINQSRGIFDKFIYSPQNGDNISEIISSGYFSKSRYLSDPDWIGSIVEVEANDGYFFCRVDSGGDLADITPAGAGLIHAFDSVASRDLYFSASIHRDTLTTDEPIIVRLATESQIQYWTGADAPASYDNNLWMISSLNVGAGTLILGVDGAKISSGARVINFVDAFGSANIPAFLEYSSAGGSGDVRTFSFDSAIVAPVNPTGGTTLPDPQELSFPTSISNTLTLGFEIIPSAAGSLRIQTWEGADDTGPVLVDNVFEILLGDVGITTMLALPNPLMLFIGDSIFTRFSGIQLDGGVQASGPLVGQTAPFLNSDLHLVTLEKLITEAPEDGIKYVRRDAAWVATVFGDFYQYAESEAVSSTDLLTFQNKVTMTTPVLDVGEYRISASAELTNDITIQPIEVRVTIDAGEVMFSFDPPKEQDEYELRSGFKVSTLTAAEHIINLDFRATGIPGTAMIRRARIEIFRVA